MQVDEQAQTASFATQFEILQTCIDEYCPIFEVTLFTIASNCTKEIEKKAQSLSVTRPVDQMPIVPTFPALNVKYDGILSFLLLFFLFSSVIY